MTPTRVLVPVDGSLLSEAVIPAVLGLRDPRFLLLRVLPSQGEGGTARERLAAELALTETADRLRARGAGQVTSMVRTGNAVEVILRVADEESAALIALTTHGRTGFNRLVLGSVAEQVIRESPIPVLALRETEAAPPEAPAADLFKEVLVPHDGSELAWRAVEGLALLGAAGKGRITLFGVVEAEFGGDPGLGAPPPSDLIARYRRAQVEYLREHLERAAVRARDLGIAATVDHTVGRPAAAILDRAGSLAATLIAMGSHGRSGLTRWTLGSVTERVLRASSTPLLICK